MRNELQYTSAISIKNDVWQYDKIVLFIKIIFVLFSFFLLSEIRLNQKNVSWSNLIEIIVVEKKNSDNLFIWNIGYKKIPHRNPSIHIKRCEAWHLFTKVDIALAKPKRISFIQSIDIFLLLKSTLCFKTNSMQWNEM